MAVRSAPSFIVLAALAAGLLLAVAMTVIAAGQPWLGLRLSDGTAGGVRVTAVSPHGPSAGIPGGAAITAIDDGAGNSVLLQPLDVIEEPDHLESYAMLEDFLDRQDRIARLLRGGKVYLTLAGGGRVEVTPAPARPLASLPGGFWLQLAVALCCLAIGSWALGLRPGETGVRLVAASSIGAAMSMTASTAYLYRELALDGGLLRFLSSFNHLGSMTFATAIFALFLVYPRRLVPVSVPVAAALAMAAAWLADALRISPLELPATRYVPMAVGLVGALAAAAVQYVRAAGDPLMRAGLSWFGLSLAVGTCVFVLMYAAPSILGLPAELPQALAYALALPVYAGIAVGVARYRLFELGEWAFGILFYVLGAMLLLVLDALLVAVVAIERTPAFALSLVAIVLLYLPLRDTLARRMLPRQDSGTLFHKVVDVALTRAPRDRDERWTQLLREAFNPLRAEAAAGNVAAPRIAQEGLALLLPRVGAVAPVRLGYADGGRRLFSGRDVELAGELCAMLGHSLASRNAYEKGAAEERIRIARDMHDNIGAKLLSALHSGEPERKNTMIRDTLSDLREIVNNAAGNPQPLADALADLRAETAERLAAAGLALAWRTQGEEEAGFLSPASAHALRSVLREAVSNAIRHAGAGAVSIAVDHRDDRLTLTVDDDGSGLRQPDAAAGNGLANMRARLETLGGTLVISNLDPGLRLAAELPTGRAP